MESPRAVRIPRSDRAPEPRVVRVGRGTAVPSPTVPPVGSAPLRPNVAGTQRVRRLSALYLVSLAFVYLVLLFVSRAARGGNTSGAEGELVLIGLVALALGGFGTVFTLHAAPRAVGVSSRAIVVLGRWGRRTSWPPLGRTTVRVVRRYPAGFLSGEAVESVELTAPERARGSYLIESTLLPTESPRS